MLIENNVICLIIHYYVYSLGQGYQTTCEPAYQPNARYRNVNYCIDVCMNHIILTNLNHFIINLNHFVLI